MLSYPPLTTHPLLQGYLLCASCPLTLNSNLWSAHYMPQYAVLCPIKKRKKKNTCACLPGIHNAQLMSVFPFSKYWGGQYLPEGVHYPHWCQWDEVCWTCYNIRRGFFPPSSLYIETFQTQPVLRDHLQSRKAIFKQPVSKRFNPQTATILALAEQQRKLGILQNS